MDIPTYTCRKNGKPYSEAAIAQYLAKEIHDKHLTDEQCGQQLFDQFGFSEELIDRITKAAKALPRPATAPHADPSPAAPQTAPVASINDISMSLTEADIFSEQHLAEAEALFRTQIPQADWDFFNQQLVKVKQRILTFRDLAIIFVAFRKNVTHNGNGGCPIASIIGFTEEHVATPYSNLHVSKAVEIFLRLGLTRIKEKHNHFKHQGTCYEMP